jgi:hypothetical protein
VGFYLPNFNLMVNDWYLSDGTGVSPTVYPGNLSLGRRINQFLGELYVPQLIGLTQWLLVPPLSEVGTLVTNPSDPDVIEAPAGSGLYYLVIDGGYIGKGFVNEHLGLNLVPMTAALQAYLADPISGLGLTVGAGYSFPAFLGG